MGLNGTLCFLAHIKSAMSSYTVVEFARCLAGTWPDVGGRIIHPDLWVRRYMCRLLSALLECAGIAFCTIWHDKDSSLIYPHRSQLHDNRGHHVVDLILSFNARSLLLMMEELDQSDTLRVNMETIGTHLFSMPLYHA